MVEFSRAKTGICSSLTIIPRNTEEIAEEDGQVTLVVYDFDIWSYGASVVLVSKHHHSRLRALQDDTLVKPYGFYTHYH